MDKVERAKGIERLYRRLSPNSDRWRCGAAVPSNIHPETALAITESLRVEGNPAARRLAERIEALCRAAL